MEKKQWIVGSLVFAGIVALAGCSKSPTGPGLTVSQSDRDAISAVINADPLYTSDSDMLDDQGANDALAKDQTAITPLAWGRKVLSASRDVTYDQVNDTTVAVTITTTISGNVYIRARYAGQAADSTVIKPFTEHTMRKVNVFKRSIAAAGSARWEAREVSAVVGGTDSSNVTINQMTVFMGSDTLVITDPTSYFLRFKGFPGPRREMPEINLSLNANERVTVQIALTSSDPDTDFVFLHRPYSVLGLVIRPLATRMQLISQTQSGGSYQRVYSFSWTNHIACRRDVLVTALTRSSLFDDQAKFSTSIWGFPYIVE